MRVGFRTWGLRVDKDADEIFTSEDKFQLGPRVWDAPAWDLEGVNECLPCGRGTRDHPHRKNCNCGFHAYWNCPVSCTEVTGAILAWGKMAGHGSEGFRAQYAKVLALLRPPPELFPAPPPPIPGRELLANAYVLHFWNCSLKDFKQVIRNMESRTDLIPAVFQWQTLDDQAIEKIWNEMQSAKVNIKKLKEDYEERTSRYALDLVNHVDESMQKFYRDMPVPIFETSAELVAYAKKFGDLGP